MKRILLLCYCFAMALSAIGQERTVTGKVTDGGDGSGLPGVSVLVKGTSRGTATNTDGAFTIVASAEETLVFSFIGFESVESLVGQRSVVDIALNASISQLSEVVVIGFGEREKKDLTGAISSMTSKDISKSTSMSPELAMQGRMAGVYVSTGGGNPNARPTVQIRGLGTFNNAQPLYVVDGVPIFEFGGGTTEGVVGDIRGNVNILNLINPGDIESISVLKDAAASAIYGSRAANGVVLITTKKGKVGAPRVEFNASRGVQNIPKTYKTLDTQEFTSVYKEMFDNDTEYRRLYAPSADPNAPYTWDNNKKNIAGVDRYFLNVFNPNSNDPYYKYLGNSPTYNWQDELQNKNAAIEDYSVRVSGGSEASTYYVGAGYSKTESPLKQNDLSRYSLSANVTTKISKVFETGFLYRGTYMEALDNTNGDLAAASRVSPWQPIYDPNDPTGYARTNDIQFEPNPAYDPSLANSGAPQRIVDGTDQLRPWGDESSTNYFAQMHYRHNYYSLIKNFGNVYLAITPLKGLKVKAGLNVDWTYNRRNEWTRSLLVPQFSETPSNPYDGTDGTAQAGYNERHARNVNITKDITVTYNKAFGNHNLELLFNASDQKFKYEIIQGGSPVQFADERYASLGGQQRYNNTISALDNKAIQGYVFRASYNFKSKYYLDASVRRDGSSEFAPESRWGTFPGVSAAWRISGEDFFAAASNTVNDLKLRAGYGELGNSFSGDQGFSRFAYLSTVRTTNNIAFGSGNGDGYGTHFTGSDLPVFPNYALSWEVAKTFNVGVDAGAFNNKLTFTAEYYLKNTEGIIQQVQLPSNAGIPSSVDFNVATVRNSGIELQLGYNEQLGDLQLGFTGNLTTVKNRVTSLYLGQQIINGDNALMEGEPIGFIYGYKKGGIFQNQAEIDAWQAVYKNAGGANPRPGDMYFQDLYGNPKQGESFRSNTPDSLISSTDRTYLGKTIPGFYYGFSANAKWKGFDVSVFFQGVGDVQKINYARAAGESMVGTGLNFWTSVRDRWTPENPSTTMPRAVGGDPAGNSRMSDRWVENASFLRLKNLQIGYTLPPKALEYLRIVNSCRFYVSATNLATFTKWKGIDPENDFIPPTRVLSFGVNAAF